MSSTELNTDIYKITDTVNTLQKKYNEDVDEYTLQMSSFGYLGNQFSDILQDAIRVGCEYGSEALPIKAKFEKTTLTNAITYNVSEINAKPAKMKVMMGFIKQELDEKMNKDGKFTLYNDVPFMIGDYEFRLDYDIIISKEDLPNNGLVYTARYDIKRKNILSDITNPYLSAPFYLTVNNDKFIFIVCTLRQYSVTNTYNKIISNNILENKTMDFDFTSELAGFEVVINDPNTNEDIYLDPIYDGMPKPDEMYCFYTYIDTNKIRIKFDKSSYNPPLNSTCQINIYTTKGSDGNFEYKDDVVCTLKSPQTNYNGLSVLIKPDSSTNGLDRKSVAELKQIIPKEILARGCIITDKDIDNYFNSLNLDNKLYFYKKEDNQKRRLYYAYFLAKDENNNVVPTNTIDLQVYESDFNEENDYRYVIKPGTVFKYDGVCGYPVKDASIYDESKDFIYSTPFIIVVNKDPLCVSYYLDIMDIAYDFEFKYINERSFLQFIYTSCECKKSYLETNHYEINLSVSQNINLENNLVTLDENNNIISSNIVPVLVFKEDETHMYYRKGEIVNYDKNSFSYDITFDIETNNEIDEKNRIKLTNMCQCGSDKITTMYAGREVECEIWMYAKLDDDYGNDGTNSLIPGIEGYTLCNKYSSVQKFELFYNYSNTIISTADIVGDRDPDKGFKIRISQVPVFRKSYIDDVDRCFSVIDAIQYRKTYIDMALVVIQQSFRVDLKFFNTYGPSNMFYIGYDSNLIDRINLTLNFKVRLKQNAEKEILNKIIKSIKTYVEDINTINSIHMTNITTTITNEYKDNIDFIEFIGMNKYNALEQYVRKDTEEIINRVPEFLNINLKDNKTPDINIETV